MLTIAVFPNIQKENSAMVLRRILKFYKDKAVRVILPMTDAIYFDCMEYGVPDIDKEPFDMGLSIGGDGTLLGLCRSLYKRNIPACGINIGTVGFLADIELADLNSKLDKILKGEYRIEERLVLSGHIKAENEPSRFAGHAINDVVISKGGIARMLHLGVNVCGVLVNDYKADGVIVSTATGSTAYSLSAGGPILDPNVRGLLVTPICAHTLDIRPMVVAEDNVVSIHVKAFHQDIQLTFDGQESFPLLPGDEVIVRKASRPAHIVKFEDVNYYHTLKNKMWSHL